MREDYLVRLLQCNMPVGEHALLWDLWEKESAATQRVAREFIARFSVTEYAVHMPNGIKMRIYIYRRGLSIPITLSIVFVWIINVVPSDVYAICHISMFMYKNR